MNYWERWIGDWKRKTAHLSAEAKGIYGELLDHEYATHKPLPLDLEATYRLAGASTPSERKSTDKVLSEFYTKTDQGYVNGRAQQEIAKRTAYVEAQRGRANARWQKDIDQETGEAPAPIRKRAAPKLNGAFVEFWDAYPRKVAKGSAEKAWIKVNPDDALKDEILSAVEAQRGSDDWKKDGGAFIPHPATWLNQRRWEDEQQEAAQVVNERCHYCLRPAVQITNNIPHCGEGRHIDHAKKGET